MPIEKALAVIHEPNSDSIQQPKPVTTQVEMNLSFELLTYSPIQLSNQASSDSSDEEQSQLIEPTAAFTDKEQG